MVETRFAAFVLVAALLIVGCSSKPKEVAEQEGERVERAAEADSQAAERERKTAFGLPLPPRVQLFQQQSADIAIVLTDMDALALEEFFKKNLVDYEVIRNRTHLRAVGLRPGMPQIKGAHLSGARSYVRLTYTSQRTVPQKKEQPEEVAERDGAGEERRDARGDVGKPMGSFKGSPVMLRTPSGELLAPGAKWGEPYTPKPGTPLHKEEFKSNWGKPFGQWQPG